MSDESQITPYKAFVNCIKMGDELNSDDGDELLEIVEGEFDRKLANGLRWRVFSLDTETSSDHEDENEEAKPRLPENEERVSPEPIGNVMEGDKPKEEPTDAADAVKAETEANSSNHEDGSPDADDSLDKPVSIDSDEDYVIARNCKESSGLPSLNKIKAAFNSINGALLLDIFTLPKIRRHASGNAGVHEIPVSEGLSSISYKETTTTMPTIKRRIQKMTQQISVPGASAASQTSFPDFSGYPENAYKLPGTFNGVEQNPGVRITDEELTKGVLLLGSTASGKTNTMTMLAGQVLAQLENNDIAVFLDVLGGYKELFCRRGMDILMRRLTSLCGCRE